MLLHFGQLRICFYFMWGFSLLHVLTFAIVYAFTPGLFKDDESNYQKLVMGMYTPELLELVDSQRNNFTLMTPSYSQSAVLGYYAGKHVPVFGFGSYHGRQDDLVTDFSKYDGKGIAILMRTKDVKQHAKYFDSFVHVVIPFRETQFHLGMGSGFKYDVYNADVLERVRNNFYRIPDWLPTGSCYMYERE